MGYNYLSLLFMHGFVITFLLYMSTNVYDILISLNVLLNNVQNVMTEIHMEICKQIQFRIIIIIFDILFLRRWMKFI